MAEFSPFGAALATLWTTLRRALRALAGLVLALVLLFEEWGWRPLAELLGWLSRFRPWARLEGVIAALPPYPALIAFTLPSALLFPVKLGALWLLAQGRPVSAALLLAAAKVVGTALVARIFQLTRPTLMRLAWFARLYDLFMPWKEALLVQVRASWAWRYGRMLKAWARQEALRMWRRWRPALAGRLALWRGRARRLTVMVQLAAIRTWRRLRGAAGR